MADNRPQGRKKQITDNSKGVARRGEGLNTGPVAGKDAHSPVGGSGRRGSGPSRAAQRGGGLSLGAVVIIVLFLLLTRGGGGLFGGGSGSSVDYVQTPAPTQSGSYGSLAPSQGSSAISNPYANLIAGSTSSWTAEEANTQEPVDETVADGVRERYTQILGNKRDTVTMMVYMCGTDLESKSAMATRDLQEMLAAKTGSQINLLIYTGGCTKWNNNVVSANVNQIYGVENGQLKRLVSDAGSKAMTDPATLSEFIQWSAANYPANRYELILWDHGGGSVSGYGYDQKFARSGSMTLAGIDKALTDGGVKFDFIGFDACLMATMETALMLDEHADYLIASEETEPGIGWYYTNWLTAFGSNPSMPTVQVGQNIVDDFVSTCARQCGGQSATLSVVDLAELAHTAPAAMKSFSQSISQLISSNQYQTVSNARNGSREFARSSAIDQIDLVHFARNLGTAEGKDLANALLGAVKYNRTSSNMSNAYGLSIYFPYRKTSQVDAAVKTYQAIGMDDSYSKCIREFASLEVSGQAAAGGSSSALGSLLGGGYGSSYGSSGSDLLGGLLGAFLGGDISSISGLDAGNTDFLFGRALSDEDTAAYIADNSFNAALLFWQRSGENMVVSLPDEQWALVEGLALNAFYDDGEGYIDLGYDYVFEFDDNGDLIAPTDHTWIAVNGQPVAFYHEYTSGEGDAAVTTGRIPAMLNDERVDLIVIFDEEHPYGYLAGARAVYADGETDTVAKALTELNEGDVIDFLCDYYRYDGSYENSYYLGEPMTVTAEMQISNVNVGDGDLLITYRFTDIFQQQYWTDPLVA